MFKSIRVLYRHAPRKNCQKDDCVCDLIISSELGSRLF